MASSLVEMCDLPDEVLCYIFSKLRPGFVVKCLMNVCHRWRSVVAENKVFWNNLQLTIDCDYFLGYSYLYEVPVDKTIYPDFTYGSNSADIFIGEEDLVKVHKLQSLKFAKGSKVIAQSVPLLMKILNIIRKECKDIEKVEFESCFGATSSQVMRFLRESYKNMKEIRITYKYKHDYSGNCQYSLPYNEISRFSNLTTLVAYDNIFKTSDLYILAEGCKCLNSLWILLCTSLEISDVLYFLERKKKSLKELGMGITLHDCILDKLKECHQLEVFFSTEARYVTDECVKSFADQSSLKYCSLHRATFQRSTVFGIAGPCRKQGVFEHLKILDLTQYYHYSEEAFESWNSSNRELSSCSEHPEQPSRLMRQIKITFSNRLKYIRKMSQLYSDSQDHWMYHLEE